MRGRLLAAALCLASISVLGALAPAGALAGPPEFVACVKVKPHKTGKYANGTCSVSGFVAGGGQNYEREHYPWTHAKKQGFKTNGRLSARWTIVNPIGGGGGPSEPAEVLYAPKCPETALGEAARGGGEMTGPKTVVWSETYKECSVVKEAWKCTGGTSKKNNIITEELEGTLVYLDAAHTRVGLRVKGLGPGGLLMKYYCPAAPLHVSVYGEFLVELTEYANSANRTPTALAREGSLKLQSPLYEEEAFSETQGKEALEWAYTMETCEHGEPPYPPGEKTEEDCLLFVGPPPAPPPITLEAKLSEGSHTRLPMSQFTTTTHRGENFLVETS